MGEGKGFRWIAIFDCTGSAGHKARCHTSSLSCSFGGISVAEKMRTLRSSTV